MPYLTNAAEETRIGDDVYADLWRAAGGPWHEIQQEYDTGDCMFLFLGASNGCIPAAFFAKQFSDKVLSLTFLSCVPGREQWKDVLEDVSKMHFPVTVTCGHKEQFFGGPATIYSFAQAMHANVFSFRGEHLHEGKDTLRRLASFVADASKSQAAADASKPSAAADASKPSAAADASKPSAAADASKSSAAAASASQRGSPRQHKSKSPSRSPQRHKPKSPSRSSQRHKPKSPSRSPQQHKSKSPSPSPRKPAGLRRSKN